MNEYSFKVGDIFYSKISHSIILISKLPEHPDNFYYRGFYNEDEPRERAIGFHESIIQAIERGEWIYYPVVE